MTQLPVYDLDQLDTNTGANRDLGREIVELFLGQAGDLVAALEAAGSGRPWFEAAHTLKGGARNIGAPRLAELAKAAEGLAEASSDGERTAIVNEIKTALGDLEREFPSTFPG